MAVKCNQMQSLFSQIKVQSHLQPIQLIRLKQGLTRMGITNCESTSAGLMSSQQYEPNNAVTAAAIWTKGGSGEISITTSISYTVQPEYLSYSILMGRD